MTPALMGRSTRLAHERRKRDDEGEPHCRELRCRYDRRAHHAQQTAAAPASRRIRSGLCRHARDNGRPVIAKSLRWIDRNADDSAGHIPYRVTPTALTFRIPSWS